jgi:phospholipid/cholesterol/gamma-HCH transport system permease protein
MGRGKPASREAAAPSDRISLVRQGDGDLIIVLAGRWLLGEAAPDPGAIGRELEERAPSYVAFDATAIEVWDSRLVAYVEKVIEQSRARGVRVDRSGLPAGVLRLLELAEAPSMRAPASPPPRWWGTRAAAGVMQYLRRLVDALRFVGEVAASIGRFLVRRARIRASDVWLQMLTSGAKAVFIVSLVSFLVGLILAFMGAVQLQDFGATIYIADLVGIAIVRELGAIMAAIVVAGRTGAAFAAEIGTMRVTEEIDALSTLGISSFDFLVLPRILALAVMLPVLTIFADVIGVLGGAAMGIFVMDIGARAYYDQTVAALAPADVIGGIVKASVYGVLIAAAGCFEGLRCRRTAAGVGRATTAAVVDGIVLVIGASGVFAVLFYVLGI